MTSETEDRLVAILDGIGECFYAIDRDWRLTVFNGPAERFFGRTRAEVLGLVIWDAFQVRAVPRLEAVYHAAMAGTPSGTMSFVSPARPDRWLEGRAFPLPDGVGVSFRDVTDRVRDEAALKRREAELARVQRIARVGGLEVILERGFENRRSPEYLAIHGLPPEAAGESHAAWVARIHPEDREAADLRFRDAVKSGAPTYQAEYRIVRPSDGAVRWIAATAEFERDETGRAVRLVGAHRDVTERKTAEMQQDLLIHELNHRVKNTLATVQSIAAQSFRAPDDSRAARAAFDSRLQALARAHDVLTRESWEGAGLGQIARQALAPYRGEDGDRVRIEGEDIRLGPRQTLAYAMAFEELATNAVKYGALSRDGGTVRLAWSVARGDGAPILRLTWTERGGPPVTAPTRRSFGSRLIERGLADAIDGTVVLSFDPEGLTCVAESPVSVSAA